ncbi:hypothetical protein E2562_035950 [Oryza meyeriana var. granulata]|uniref:Uncharacterized protein n=1 Tax=Oryza meyeriana var. granulata TaxID=110450 RepID=A0A6G1FG66_9ORYZ|nr:hypothetical protein E2562_035950 [Oryza meyeriana var. granulata]
MATRVLSRESLRKLASFSLLNLSLFRRAPNTPSPEALRPAVASYGKCLNPFYLFSPPWMVRWASHSSVNLVLSDDGKPKFEIEEVEPSRKRGYLTKKQLKLKRKREKKKRKEANKNDPRRIRTKGKKIKQKFPTPEARLKYKIEKAKLKEAMLVEKLKKYEVAKAQGPMVKQDDLDGEERFYLKKALEKSKYEQSLETVRRFIAVSEKELELYYQHVALYGSPQSQNVDPVYCDDRRASSLKTEEPSKGKDQVPHIDTNGFSDITDTFESDEEGNSSEYDGENDDSIGGVLYDHGEFKVQNIVLPGNLTVAGVSKSIKCDKGERMRFRSAVLSFQHLEGYRQTNATCGYEKSIESRIIFLLFSEELIQRESRVGMLTQKSNG